MRFEYREHPEATEELLDAIRYYHGERPGLGDDMAVAVRTAVRDVVRMPDSWPPIAEWDDEPVLRSRRISVFPYRVVYYVRNGVVVIVAYAHVKRRPAYWTHRLP